MAQKKKVEKFPDEIMVRLNRRDSDEPFLEIVYDPDDYDGETVAVYKFARRVSLKVTTKIEEIPVKE